MKKLNDIIVSKNNICTIENGENFCENINLKFTAKKIAFKIFYELKSQKLTQQDLANILSVTPQNISKLLKGDDYKLSTLVKIEEALSINLIDRDIYNNKNNISVIFHVKSFEIKRKPLIVKKSLYILNDSFELSNDILEAEIFDRTINFEQSINEYF